jgi:hypothetical protein
MSFKEVCKRLFTDITPTLCSDETNATNHIQNQASKLYYAGRKTYVKWLMIWYIAKIQFSLIEIIILSVTRNSSNISVLTEKSQTNTRNSSGISVLTERSQTNIIIIESFILFENCIETTFIASSLWPWNNPKLVTLSSIICLFMMLCGRLVFLFIPYWELIELDLPRANLESVFIGNGIMFGIILYILSFYLPFAFLLRTVHSSLDDLTRTFEINQPVTHFRPIYEMITFIYFPIVALLYGITYIIVSAIDFEYAQLILILFTLWSASLILKHIKNRARVLLIIGYCIEIIWYSMVIYGLVKLGIFSYMLSFIAGGYLQYTTLKILIKDVCINIYYPENNGIGYNQLNDIGEQAPVVA